MSSSNGRHLSSGSGELNPPSGVSDDVIELARLRRAFADAEAIRYRQSETANTVLMSPGGGPRSEALLLIALREQQERQYLLNLSSMLASQDESRRREAERLQLLQTLSRSEPNPRQMPPGSLVSPGLSSSLDELRLISLMQDPRGTLRAPVLLGSLHPSLSGLNGADHSLSYQALGDLPRLPPLAQVPGHSFRCGDTSSAVAVSDRVDSQSVAVSDNESARSRKVSSVCINKVVSSRVSGPEPFPERLFRLLLEQEGKSDDIVAFTPSGKGFWIHDRERFVDEIVPKYFRQSKWPSFLRQMNIYGFHRETSGPEGGSYSHPRFRRDKPQLLSGIPRNA